MKLTIGKLRKIVTEAMDDDDDTFAQDEVNDDDILIEELRAGFYVVGNFKRVASPRDVPGVTVYSLSPYGAGDELLFTGEILWRNNDVYETSSAIDAVAFDEPVPAGTLIVALDQD